MTLTRQGARYAATHCWQDSGANVVTWMVANCPAPIDRQQLGGQIVVQYWQTDLTDRTNPVTTPFAGNCDVCTPGCQPDSVTVGISGYQFSSLVRLVGMQPIQVPAFATTVEMQSMGGNPDIGVSSP